MKIKQEAVLKKLHANLEALRASSRKQASSSIVKIITESIHNPEETVELLRTINNLGQQHGADFYESVRNGLVQLYGCLHPTEGLRNLFLYDKLKYAKKRYLAADTIRRGLDLEKDKALITQLDTEFDFSFCSAGGINNEAMTFSWNARNLALYGLRDREKAREVALLYWESVLFDLHMNSWNGNNSDGYDKSLINSLLAQEKDSGILSLRDILGKVRRHARCYAPGYPKETEFLEELVRKLK